MSQGFEPEELSILSRIVSRLLNLRKGTPIRQTRVSLGEKRVLLDRLVNLGHLKIQGDQYLPTFMVLYCLDPTVRNIGERLVNAVFTALRNLYMQRERDTFTFEEILGEVQRLDPTLDENDLSPALILATDFDFISGWSAPSTPEGLLRLTNISVKESILDFRSAEAEWNRVLAQRQAARERRTVGLVGQVTPSLPPSIPNEFSFVSDGKLRGIIERDFTELGKAKQAAALKTRLILSGGLVEALLLDALGRNKERAMEARTAEKDSKGKVKPLDDWNLSSLIDTAAELSLISDGAVRLSNVVRDFRNLVHAGKERRGDYVIGDHEAEAAEAGLSAVTRDLRARSRGKM